MYVACTGERRGVYRVLGGNLRGRTMHRWKNNIKMDLQDVA